MQLTSLQVIKFTREVEMKAFSRITLLAFLCAALLSSTVLGQILGFDPALRWKTLETEHFNIIFHQGLEELAQEAAVVAEESYTVIQKEFGNAPKKVDLFIVDIGDTIFGFVHLPYNLIGIAPAQMRMADWANVRLDSWMRVVIFHELLHVVDIDQVSGIPKLLRSVFGRVALPNLTKPIPFIEGLAVYEKYKHLGESRHNDPRTTMFIRQMVAENKIPRFDEISVYYTRANWPPGGFLVYNFGSWLLRYIEETYGKDSMAKIVRTNSERLLNLLVLLFGDNFDSVLKKAIGKSADEIYGGFRQWLRGKFSAEIKEIEKVGVTQSLRLTQLGWYSNQPAWAPDGKQIAYAHRGPGRSGIRLINADGESDREIISGFVDFPAWSPNGKKLLYIKPEIQNTFYIFGDLALYDLEKKKEWRLTRGARAFYATFTPDGKKILFARNIKRDGSTAIAVFDLVTKKISTLKEFPNNDMVVHSFEISPDGSQLALSIWKRGGYQDIYLMPATGGELTPATQDKHVDLDPTWSPDGQYVLFSSDRGGVSNLYAYRVSDSAFLQVTNLISGAYDPDISPDSQKIAFTGYSTDGYDVHVMEYDPNSWKPKTEAFQKETIPEWPGFPKTDYKVRPYSPIASLLPKLWLPIVTPGGVGFFTLGQDAVFQHFYKFSGGWDFQRKRPFYFLDYTNAQLVPFVRLTLGQDRWGRRYGAGLLVPLSIKLNTQQLLSLGYRRSESFKEAEISHRLTLAWSFDSFAIADLFADTLGLSIEGELEKIAGLEQLQRRLILDWRESFRLPIEGAAHSLALKLTVGWTDAEDIEKRGFSLGGESGRFMLRGYEPKALKGRQALSSSLEYRFPLISIERAPFGYWPLFFDDLRGSFFVDAGIAGEMLDPTQLRIGFGAELNLSLTTGYFSRVGLRLGVAQGLGEQSPRIYMAFSL